MKIGIVGSGYVGTTIGACFADLGHEIMIVDDDDSVVRRLNDGTASFSEPGVDDLLSEYAGVSLLATTDHDDLVGFGAEVIVLALPTRPDDDGVDTAAVEAGAESLGPVLDAVEGYPTVVVTNAVVPGTTDDVVGPTLELESGGRVGVDFGLATHPEFLREGSAIDDFTAPNRLVFGTDGDDRALDALETVYDPLDADPAVVRTGLREAEMIKYADSAVRATRASLVDELDDLCDEYGVDAAAMTGAVDLDGRIGADGDGWGVGRSSRDISAIVAAARDDGFDPALLGAAVDVDARQPQRMLDRLDHHVDVEGERVAVLGLAFRPETDDIENSRAIPILEGLQARGATVVAYDPNEGAAARIRKQFPDVEVLASPSPTLSGATATLVLTDWPAFADLDLEFDLMSGSVVIDGPGIVERRDGISYEGLRWT